MSNKKRAYIVANKEANPSEIVAGERTGTEWFCDLSVHLTKLFRVLVFVYCRFCRQHGFVLQPIFRLIHIRFGNRDFKTSISLSFPVPSICWGCHVIPPKDRISFHHVMTRNMLTTFSFSIFSQNVLFRRIAERLFKSCSIPKLWAIRKTYSTSLFIDYRNTFYMC